MEQHEQLMVRAIAAYRQVAATQIDSASAGGVVSMLLHELIDTLVGIGGALTGGQGQRLLRLKARAEIILLSLESSLNSDAGDLSERLAGIYREVRRLLVAAVTKNDPDRCDQACELVRPIAEAFHTIAAGT